MAKLDDTPEGVARKVTTFLSTNLIENVFRNWRVQSGNVKRWNEKQDGQDAELLQKREKLLESKRKENPSRWIKGTVRNCQPSGQVNLYPINNRPLEKYQKNVA